jgi:hypothetical protein
MDLGTDSLLKMFGFTDQQTGRPIEKFEQLNTDEERETFLSMASAYKEHQITPDKLKEHIQKNKDIVEEKLAELVYCKETPENWSKVKYLMARLINYKTLEAFFAEPEIFNKKIEQLAKQKLY